MMFFSFRSCCTCQRCARRWACHTASWRARLVWDTSCAERPLLRSLSPTWTARTRPRSLSSSRFARPTSTNDTTSWESTAVVVSWAPSRSPRSPSSRRSRLVRSNRSWLHKFRFRFDYSWSIVYSTMKIIQINKKIYKKIIRYLFFFIFRLL